MTFYAGGGVGGGVKKSILNRVKNESTEISIKSLSKIAEHQDGENVQAIFHDGRYALSQSYNHTRNSPWKFHCCILGLKRGAKIT